MKEGECKKVAHFDETLNLVEHCGKVKSPNMQQCFCTNILYIQEALLQGNINQALPLVILGLWILIGGLAVILLPETVGQKMPNTLSEGELLQKRYISREVVK